MFQIVKMFSHWHPVMASTEIMRLAHTLYLHLSIRGSPTFKIYGESRSQSWLSSGPKISKQHQQAKKKTSSWPSHCRQWVNVPVGRNHDIRYYASPVFFFPSLSITEESVENLEIADDENAFFFPQSWHWDLPFDDLVLICRFGWIKLWLTLMVGWWVVEEGRVVVNVLCLLG